MEELSLPQRDLYRAIGELAYAIAKADNILSKVERMVFEEAVKSDLGKEGWLAKDRFDMLADKLIKTDLEKTYHHVLYMIRQNKDALNTEMTDKFISILEKVAGVSGISEEEKALMDRFREDVNKIHNE